ncbi:MAG: type II toxin-antitoxin system HicA family toxin [Thermoguttaceae bacterium]
MGTVELALHRDRNRNASGGGSGLMARLPRWSGREVVRIFESLGWEKARQSGSHMILVRQGRQATLSRSIACGR